MSAPLFDYLAADLPRGFAEAMLVRMPLLYAEAYESVMHDPRFDEPEARYLHRHIRRALVEKSLRDIGGAHGMKVEMRRADGVGGPEHVMLSVARFCFTCCYLPALREFPQESRHREQYSLTNEHAAQVQMFPVNSRPTEHGIYGIIFHREAAGDKSKLGTLSVGIPNEKCDDWLEEPINLLDLADAQQSRELPQDAAKSASPKWKHQINKKEDKG
jgi:hypothetical protein